MSKAWIFQKADDLRDQGDGAPWYVGWLEPDGRRKSKSCGAGSTGKKAAARLKSKLTAELMTGIGHRDRLGVVGELIARKQGRRLERDRGVEPKFLGQRGVEHDELRIRHGRGCNAPIEARRQAGVGVLKTEAHDSGRSDEDKVPLSPAY